MPRISNRLGPLLLGMVIGLTPAYCIALVEGTLPALYTPLQAVAYTSFMALAVIAATCLLRPAHRWLGLGILLGLIIIAAYYVALFVMAYQSPGFYY